MWPRWPGPGRRRRECGCGTPRWTASRAGCSPPGTCRPAAHVQAYAVLAGTVVLVAEWGLDSFGDWPEIVRVTAAFTMGVLTDLEARGADLRPGEGVDLEAAAVTAAVGLPASVQSAPSPVP